MKVTLGVNSSVTIDGRTFSGRNVSIVGDKVIVDGVTQDGTLVGPINVVVNGNAESVSTVGGDISVTGSVTSVKSVSGDVTCGTVSGDVNTVSGDVQCPSICGKVKTTSGDIIGGSRR